MGSGFRFWAFWSLGLRPLPYPGAFDKEVKGLRGLMGLTRIEAFRFYIGSTLECSPTVLNKDYYGLGFRVWV